MAAGRTSATASSARTTRSSRATAPRGACAAANARLRRSFATSPGCSPSLGRRSSRLTRSTFSSPSRSKSHVGRRPSPTGRPRCSWSRSPAASCHFARRTRRTLSVVACLPQTWARSRAGDRHRVRIGSARPRGSRSFRRRSWAAIWSSAGSRMRSLRWFQPALSDLAGPPGGVRRGRALHSAWAAARGRQARSRCLAKVECAKTDEPWRLVETPEQDVPEPVPAGTQSELRRSSSTTAPTRSCSRVRTRRRHWLRKPRISWFPVCCGPGSPPGSASRAPTERLQCGSAGRR